MDRVADAKQALQNFGKQVTPSRMVAELNFGFWTGFFNKAHGQTGIGHHLAKTAFLHAPTNERNPILKPLLETGWVKMIVPEKPNSRLQKYRITPAGRDLLRDSNQT